MTKLKSTFHTAAGRHVRTGRVGERHVVPSPYRGQRAQLVVVEAVQPRQRVVLHSRPAQVPPGTPVTGSAVVRAVTA